MVDVWRKINERDTPPERCDKCGRKDKLERLFKTAGFAMDHDGHKQNYTSTGPRDPYKGGRR